MTAESKNIFCKTEYSTLHKVILCEPNYMSINDPNHKEYKNVSINIDLAVKQHKHFIRALKSHGVEVVFLPPDKTFPDQVFTRDIGFTIGNRIYVADMQTYLRQGEEVHLIKWLEKEQLPFHQLQGYNIEGGDIMIDGETVYIGLSKRTNLQAVSHLQALLPKYEVIPVPFNDAFLHLDCVFNILSSKEALICSSEVNSEQVKLLKSRYFLIEMTKEELFTHSANVLSIGNKKVFSMPININVNKQLQSRGYEVIEVDVSEITKSGGAFRCCTLPISRS
ncbi:dimethylarginine dimethylaminohydrolase family protein [Cytobacillus massiliigabonensis]|uniref:dimethylarginine dimethylaminohydrolase family protein n=1 Tax=Cytobacillus massiliigabonensis TaxID=1871011 RepID=UPI000C84018B|nr:dimethylarginine dimethylaminohydrolase family protein [Cytobacillus massiliigabonensis]